MKAAITMLKTASPLALALAVTAVAAPANPAPVGPARPVTAQSQSRAVRGAFPYNGPIHEIRGVVRSIDGTTVTLQTRGGLVTVDAGYALANYQTTSLFPGRQVLVRAVQNGRTVVAREILREHVTSEYWPPDR